MLESNASRDGTGAASDMSPRQRLLQLTLLALAICAANYARFSLGPLQEATRADLRLSDNQMAVLQGATIALPMAFASLPMGLVLDRFPLARLFVFFMALNVIGLIIAASAPDFATLFLARLITGMVMAAVFVASYALVGALYPPAQRGRATMLVQISEIGGAPIAFALGGFLLASWPGVADGWRHALQWMTAPLVAVWLLMFAVREPRRIDINTAAAPVIRIAQALWKYRTVAIPLLLTRIMVWTADGAALVWGAPYFTRQFNLPPEQVGSIMATALLVSGVAGPVLGGSLGDFCQRRGGPRATVSALCLATLASVPAAMFGVLPNPTLAGATLTAFLTLGFMINVMAFALSSIVLPDELRGPYFGITFMVAAIVGLGLAPLVVSQISGMLSGEAAIGKALAITCSATSMIGTAIFLLSRRYFHGHSKSRQGTI